ncbi:hypothetical protein GCM10010399_84020 [Dactylosporangium fulvum]|uniref:Fe2OG dioxygenase domain-containing protein n=1 Tax=Dactylosporangium fulvum TaxID=53359 RepID=A0ABY5VRY0_9ACTN|nr:2OG-Fe(II) oxygenase family protein [Dactylosporangium fulvum]UWP80527.1 hypothetical protein Dfulv_35960 [Dactylosporangium fulvum]
MTTVPIIDLEAALAAEPGSPELATVRAAAEQVGVVQVTNHGVAAEVIDNFHRPVDRILALPRAVKERLASPTGHPYRGWRQWPDDYGRLELERFSFGQYDDPAEASAAGVPAEYHPLFAHANVWPAQEPGLRAAADAYRAAFVGVARRVLGLYARAIGVDVAVFPWTGPEYTSLVVNDYPTWTRPDPGTDEEKLLLLEHADNSVLTVLHQEGDYAGLQAQGPDGGWSSVPVVPGALQVFSGSLLSNWTNGRLAAGRHRVVAGGTVTRRSAAVFVHPSLDTVVEPLPEFVGDGEPDFDPHHVGRAALGSVEDYLQVFGRPEQVAAYREGRPYVAAVEEPV